MLGTSFRASILCLWLSISQLATAASQCAAGWASGFYSPGTSAIVNALAVFDDGTGPALYVGGDFSAAGVAVANGIAKWDGQRWSPLGSGIPRPIAGHTVKALVAFDDGTGPALYAGGEFTAAGEVAAGRIAKWDGKRWLPLGSGVSTSNSPYVSALAVFDDGTGPALYVAGRFTTAGGVAANNIAKWDGKNWSPLGSGLLGVWVNALAVFDDGTGPALYAGGNFGAAGGVPANYIAKWDGKRWSALGSGMDNEVLALAVFDDSTGPALYAGGWFGNAGGVAARRMAKWDGKMWSALGNGLNGNAFSRVLALSVFDDGRGPALYAGGQFNIDEISTEKDSIAKWDGTNWSQLPGTGRDDSSQIYALAGFDDGSGPALYAGGRLAGGSAILLDGFPANDIAKWDGTTWSAIGSSGNGLNDSVGALAIFDDGTGPALYAGGPFTVAGDIAANRTAKWGGGRWSPLGDGMPAEKGFYLPSVGALAAFDDGTGSALYAGGWFTIAGDAPTTSIARWDGQNWSALGSGMSAPIRTPVPYVHALAVFDDGTGPALYAAGWFDKANGIPALNIAKWDGQTWSALGSGLSGPYRDAPDNPGVDALAVFDDGTGPALYAGGRFTLAGGAEAIYIAKWDGQNWFPVGGGMSAHVGRAYVKALTVFDDGTGPALYAGGDFTAAGGTEANRIAKWDGRNWSALGDGFPGEMGSRLPQVSALAVFDDGAGPALYAGGYFSIAGDVNANNIAKWDGRNWSRLGNGTDWDIYALLSFDDGTGPALYAGGYFTVAGDTASWHVAAWRCLEPETPK